MNYNALDGSPTIVKMLQEKFPQLLENIKVADFTKEIPFDPGFNMVVDRASLTCNNTESIRKSLSIIHEKMQIGGSFFGIDWFSTNHSDFNNSDISTIVDDNTRSNYCEGQFAGTGLVHFSDKEHIQGLFTGFEIIILEEKRIYRTIPLDNHIFASWNIHAIKK